MPKISKSLFLLNIWTTKVPFSHQQRAYERTFELSLFMKNEHKPPITVVMPARKVIKKGSAYLLMVVCL